MKRILYFIALSVCIVLCVCGCSSKYTQYIEEVKNGYLGGCLDVTVDEVLSQSMPKGKWDGGETDEGKIIVEYRGILTGSETRIQFTVTDEHHFKVSAMKGDTVQPKTAADAAAVIKSRYIQYYSNKYPDKTVADMLPKEANENLLNGISSAYAEKAKNPIDIADYLDKTPNEVKTALNLTEDEDGTLSNSEIFIMYDENQKMDTVSINNSRIYSLLGLQTYQSFDGVSEKIGDRFEKISEREEQDSKSAVFVRNNSSDSLMVRYDTERGYIAELTYICDGAADYRAEQERMRQEEAKKNVSVYDNSNASNSTAQSIPWQSMVGEFEGENLNTIYLENRDGQPYLILATYRGGEDVEGFLTLLDDGSLFYFNGGTHSFTLKFVDRNTIELIDDTWDGNIVGKYTRWV